MLMRLGEQREKMHIQLLKAVEKQADDTISLVKMFLHRGADVNYTDAKRFLSIALGREKWRRGGDEAPLRHWCKQEPVR
jgi:hypothetical protein